MLCKHFQPTYVVGMAVSDENSPYSGKRYAVTVKSGVKPLKAYAAINKDTALFRADKCGIAFTGAEKRIYSCHYPFVGILEAILIAKSLKFCVWRITLPGPVRRVMKSPSPPKKMFPSPFTVSTS